MTSTLTGIVNPLLAVQIAVLEQSLFEYVERMYLHKWLEFNISQKPEKSSLPFAKNKSDAATLSTANNQRASQVKAAFLFNRTGPIIWGQMFADLDFAVDAEIKNNYKTKITKLETITPFAIRAVRAQLVRMDSFVFYTTALTDYFGLSGGVGSAPNYDIYNNPMFILSSVGTGEEEEFNDLIEVLTEYAMHSFYETWIGANWKAGVTTVPIVPYDSDSLIAARKDHHTKMEFINKDAFKNAPGGWAQVLQKCRESVETDAKDHHLPPVLPGPLRLPISLAMADVKIHCRNKVKIVLQGFVADAKFTPMFQRFFGIHYDKTKLAVLSNAAVNVHSFPMSDRAEIEHSYAFWSNNVSIAFDNAPVKAAVKNYFDNVDPILVPSFVSDGAARKQVLTQIGDWYKTAIENPADTVLKGLGTVLKDYSNAFAVAPFGAEVKGIVGSPVTRLSGLTTSIATALSVLRQKAPVFQHDAEAWSSCVVLLAFSSDISGSIIMSLVTLFMMFGYKQGEIADILSGLGQPEFSRVYPQIHELIQAGAAFPSEMDRLVRDAGLNDISLDLGLEHAVGEWVGNALKPFADAEQSFKDIAGTIRDTAVGTTQKVTNAFTQSAHANDGPNAAVMGGKDTGKKDVNIIPPFDTWFDILSLSAILGPFNDALSAATNGVSTTFKNADKALATIEKVYDQPSVYIQNITRVSEDVDKLVNIRKDVLKKVGDILIDGSSGLKTPQFAALAVPLVKGGTEKLRFILNDMIINSPSRPKELDAPYGMIIPIILVGASTLQAPVELVRDALFKMFTITEIKK